MREAERQRLEELVAKVRGRGHSPHVRKRMVLVFGGLFLFCLIPFGAAAIIERDTGYLILWPLFVVPVSSIAILVYFLTGLGWKKRTSEAVRAALSREPLLTFFTEKYGLVFINEEGYFVERPDLAFQPWYNAFWSTEARKYLEKEHAIEIRGRVLVAGSGPQEKVVVFVLPKAIDPESAKTAIARAGTPGRRG